jgi:hypothetical protein
VVFDLVDSLRWGQGCDQSSEPRHCSSGGKQRPRSGFGRYRRGGSLNKPKGVLARWPPNNEPESRDQPRNPRTQQAEVPDCERQDTDPCDAQKKGYSRVR